MDDADSARRNPSRTPPEYAVLAVLIVAHAAVSAGYAAEYSFARTLNEGDLHFYSAIGVSFLLSLSLFCVQNRVVFRLLWLARFALFLVLMFRFRSLHDVRLVLMTAYVFDAGVFDEYPTNLGVQLGAIAAGIVVFDLLPVRYRAVSATGLLWMIPVVVMALSSSFFTCYRERTISLQRRNHTLDSTVAQLSQTNIALQEVAFHTGEESKEQERSRVSRDIHDIVGHTMTNLVMMMEAATDLVLSDPERVEAIMQSARDLASNGLQETRSALHDLRQRREPQPSCIAAVRQLVHAYANVGYFRVSFEPLTQMPESYGSAVDSTVYHLVQEGLTNAIRHGKATSIRVIMFVEPGYLTVSVCDDGVGSPEIKEGIGFAGMRERLHRVNGTLTIGNSRIGFEVTARIPVSGAYERKGRYGQNASLARR